LTSPTTDRPLRVLFVVFTRSSLGHIVRSTTAAARFAAEGHDVAVACHEEARDIPAKAGLTWLPIDEIGPAPAWRGMNDPERLREFIRGRLAAPAYVEASLADELRVIDEFRPDVVLSDMRNTAGVAAAMRGLPSFSIHNLKLFRHPMHVILPEVLATLSSLGVADAHARRVLGDAMLVPDIALLDDLSVLPAETAALICSLTSEIRHIGPLIPPELAASAARPSGPDGPGGSGDEARRGRPLVHVTLGGSGAGDHEIRRVAQAVADLDVHLAVTLGAAATPEQVAEAQRGLEAVVRSATVAVTGFRHDAVELTRAADAAVLHGGHASMIEGLVLGTPLVFLPHSTEQRLNARRVEELGLGAVLTPDDDETAVRAKIEQALGLKGRPALTRFAEALVAADGAGRMVEYVTRSWELARAVAA
jgi:UDP:flavonoid glycosyltransferase YjiC (YdhE family)